VDYEYRIGKFEISRSMVEKANADSALAGAPLNISLADMTAYGGNGADKPATGVSWFDAARFVNWLNTSEGHLPAYKFDANNEFQLWQPGDQGYDANNLFRNANAFYFLPSMDEWYKAAFYDPVNAKYWDYPDGTNGGGLTPVASGTAPHTAVFLQDTFAGPANIMQAGGLSPYGTMAQGGNMTEWDESALDLSNNSALEPRGYRGGPWDDSQSGLSAYFHYGANPIETSRSLGFRVASIVPEPNAVILLLLAVVHISLVRRSRISQD
jgi:formylglycine-generating enzyme required for sulfatase activity